MQTYPTGYAESHHIAEQIFRDILPRRGMAVREEQIALCHEVLDTLYNKEISLCEAGVGTGKTLAYLVACILWQMNRPEQMKLPIVISTSSVALQDAILTEYLPDLSAILLDEGIITAPITAVVRKGKERFVCDARLAERASLVHTIYPKENSKWNPRTIHAILRNEKYIGDSLYQKTYTTDSLPLKRYLNTGQRSKCYAMETHEGIISKTDYEKVQNLLAKKSITGEIDRTCVFSKKIYCSICGAICSRKGPPTQGFVWCCRTHLQSKALCLLKSIREDELQQAFLSIYNRLQCNQKTILEPLVDDLLGLRHLQEQKYKKRLALGEDIQHLAKQKHNLTRIHTLGYIEEPQFIERSAAIEQQIRERKQQLSRNDMSNTSEKILQKTRLIQKKLSSTPPLELFDESVFKELVKKVLISNTAIQFELINGMKLSESRAAT